MPPKTNKSVAITPAPPSTLPPTKIATTDLQKTTEDLQRKQQEQSEELKNIKSLLLNMQSLMQNDYNSLTSSTQVNSTNQKNSLTNTAIPNNLQSPHSSLLPESELDRTMESIGFSTTQLSRFRTPSTPLPELKSPNPIDRTSDQIQVKIVEDAITFHGNKDSQEHRFHIQKVEQIAESYRKSIPNLVVSETERNLGPRHSSNFEAFNRALLQYIQIVSPSLWKLLSDHVTNMNISPTTLTNFTGLGKLPQLPSDVSKMTLLQLNAVLAEKVGQSEYSFLITNFTTDFMQAYHSLCAYFSPNTSTRRSEEISNFWRSKIQEGQDVTMFGNQLLNKAISINNRFGREHIAECDLICALLNGVRDHPIYAGKVELVRMSIDVKYSQAVGILRDYGETNIQSSTDSSPTANFQPRAHMARTRGGRYGGPRGKGRGGKGKGGVNHSLSEPFPNQQDANGTPVFNNTYITTQDQDGNTLVGKAQPLKNLSKPQLCPFKFKYKKCTRRSCEYDHSFNIVPSPSAATVSNLTQVGTQSEGVPYQTKLQSESTVVSNLATVQTQEPSSAAQSKEMDNEFDFPKYNPRYFDNDRNHFHAKMCKLPTNHTRMYFSSSFIHTKLTHLLSQNNCLIPIYFLLLPLLLLLTTCYTIFNISLSLFSRLLVTKRNIFAFTANPKRKGDPYFTSKLPIIDDSGCNKPCSGDKNLFVSLRPIQPIPITVADGGNSSAATHVGIIRIGHLETEAYYVPNFKQTLISKGYLFRMGYLPVYDETGKMFYKDMRTQKVMVTFKIADDNLYYLCEEQEERNTNKIFNFSS